MMSPSVFKLALAAVGMAALLWSAPPLAAGDECKGCARAGDPPGIAAGVLSKRNMR